MILKYTPFGGIIPKADPSSLPPTGAQVATNVRFSSGMLEAYNSPSEILTLERTDTQTIYRFKQSLNSDTDAWFQWHTDVNCVKGAIANDVMERTFFTGDGFPKQTNNTIATSSVPYPSAYRRIGIPAPSAAPVCTPDGAHASTAIAESRIYIYTFVSDLGEESAPSPASSLIEVYPSSSEVTHQATTAVAAVFNTDGTVKTPEVKATEEIRTQYPAQTVSILMGSAPSGSFVTTSRRLYRSVTGSVSTEYLFVVELPAGTTSYTDSKAAIELGEICPTIDSNLLSDLAKGLTAMPNGIMAAHTDYDVYFCDAYKPYSWPAGYSQAVDYPVVGLASFGTSLAVLTQGYPYIITGTDPQSMSLEKQALPYACLSKRSICTAMGGAVYAAADGLIQVGNGGLQVLTDALFTRREWNALNPTSMMCAVWDDRIFIFYDNGTKAGMILDSSGLTNINTYATAHFTDPVTGSLFLAVNGKLVKWDAGVAGTYTWRSRREILPMPKNFAYAQVIATNYAGMTMKVYADQVLKHTQTVANDKPFRLPAGFRARMWEIELAGTGRLISAVLADSAEELQNV